MRYSDIPGDDVCRFICGGSTCAKICCMVQVLGRCFDITTAWEEGRHDDLLRVMKWRVQHGEKTAEELARIGIRLKAVIV